MRLRRRQRAEPDVVFTHGLLLDKATVAGDLTSKIPELVQYPRFQLDEPLSRSSTGRGEIKLTVTFQPVAVLLFEAAVGHTRSGLVIFGAVTKPIPAGETLKFDIDPRRVF